jgi:hypothetical protein
MIQHDIIDRDLSISADEYRELSYDDKVEHRMRVILGVRRGVGGFAMRVSRDDLIAFKEKEHIRPDGKPYDVHPYDMLRQLVVDCLASQGVYSPAVPEAQDAQAA